MSNNENFGYSDPDDFGFDRNAYRVRTFGSYGSYNSPSNVHGEGRKTKYTHPYSYDPFTTFFKDDVKANGSVYSDRCYEWDSKKHDDCVKRAFPADNEYGYRIEWNDPKKVEEYLRLYLGDPALILVEIIEMCNVGSGYPVWCFTFYQKK